MGILSFCCARPSSKAPPSDPSVLFSQAMKLFNQGRLEKAKEAFSRLVGYFPEERDLVAKAELKMADCAFLRKEYSEAIERYTEFKKRYPFHPDVPYADFQIAMCHFKQMRPKDRDQEPTREALRAFEEVLQKYPDTIFAEKAHQKIALCKRRLAEHEIYVGKFYLRKGKYRAAFGRFLSAWQLKGSGKEDEALYLLAVVSQKMGRYEEALKYLETLKEEFPSSRFVRKAEALREKLRGKGAS
ncbi:MAG: hypothetical protein DRG31_00460 [Deltaproteobacteria bacterium]|nr:MAG: hypothetical protein DRG31_00460 [Deltaproteobacteria bacterium]